MRTGYVVLAMAGWRIFAQGELPPLDERALIEAVLRSDPGLQVLFVENRIDSLSLQIAQSAWLPQGEVHAELSTPLDGGGPQGSGGAQLNQYVPGGGTLSAAVSGSESGYAVRASARQPLLAAAWRQGRVEYALRLAGLNRERFSRSATHRIAGTLSQARRAYWELCGASHLMTVSGEWLQDALRRSDIERARFLIGDAAPLDTLDAHIEYLKAVQSHFADSVTWYRARANLASLLGVSPQEVRVVVPDEIGIDALPTAGALLARVREWDPELDLLDLMRRELLEGVEHRRNALLPDASAGVVYSYSSTVSPTASFSDNAVVQLLLSWDLGVRERRQGIARERLRLEKNELEQQERVREMERGVEELVRAWGLELQRAALAARAREAAQHALTVSRIGYEQGSVSRMEYLKAHNDLAQQSFNDIARRLELKKMEIEIDRMTGTVFGKYGVEVP